MFKSYFFLEGEPGIEPFAARGMEAADQLRSAIPSAAGYVQTRTLSEQINADEQPPYVGIAEVWFARASEALDSGSQVNSLSKMLAGGVRVGPIVTGAARTVMRLPAHHTGRFIKGVFPFRRKSGLGVAEFQRYWWLNHGPIAALTESAVYYLQCHPLAEDYARGTPPYDGITELHWPDVGSARAAMASRQMREDQSNDAQNFAEPGSVVLFLAQEEVVFAA